MNNEAIAWVGFITIGVIGVWHPMFVNVSAQSAAVFGTNLGVIAGLWFALILDR